MFCVAACIDCPMRCVTESSRSDTARASSACRPEMHLAHGVHAPGRFGLDARDLGHALFEFAGLGVLPRRFVAARARGSARA